ncbi:MAG TPA: WYL domain-containing protein [Pseudorhodoplanes sp.]|nr:WYL domain-containing protein [Pseudorhodoplanes sp.]
MQDVLIAAIEGRRLVSLWYEPGKRIIEPHALGWGSAGQILLRAFQIEGASASGEHVNWKLFRLDRIGTCSHNGETFSGPRPEYKQNDKAMKGGIIRQL